MYVCIRQHILHRCRCFKKVAHDLCLVLCFPQTNINRWRTVSAAGVGFSKEVTPEHVFVCFFWKSINSPHTLRRRRLFQ